MSKNSQHLPIGYKIGNHYEITEVLGQGGFGIVYLVKDTHRIKDNIFIVKELFIRSDSFRHRGDTTVGTSKKIKKIFEKIKEDIREEVNILSPIENKNIVQAYGYIEENNTIYSIMEHIEGIDLEEYIKENPFDEEQTIDLLEQIINGLKEIHAQNIIHRDIKPSNIMRTQDGIYKIIDFTTNKTYSDNETTITNINSQGYTAPELLKTKAVIGDFCDIYSIGMTLYKVLSLKNPPTMADRFNDSYFQESIDNLDVSYGFREIIRKMTTKEVEDRFGSLGEIEEELDSLVNKNHGCVECLPIGYKIGNRYKIIKILDKSGLDFDYLVKDKYQLNKIFVIKELFVQQLSMRVRDSNSVLNKIKAQNIFKKIKEKIIREVNIFSNIRNKNIVESYGYLEENNTIYFIMEYIDGINLEEYLINKSFNEDEGKEFLKQIMNGLKEIYNYDNEINICITPSTISKKLNTYKIIDFNKELFSEEIYEELFDDATSISPRSINYFPLERLKQMNNNKIKIGEFNSIYSIGLILYEALSSKRIPSITDRIISNDSEFQININNLNISESFKNIIRKMTAIEVEDRFQTFQEIEDSLDGKSDIEETTIDNQQVSNDLVDIEEEKKEINNRDSFPKKDIKEGLTVNNSTDKLEVLKNFFSIPSLLAFFGSMAVSILITKMILSWIF